MKKATAVVLIVYLLFLTSSLFCARGIPSLPVTNSPTSQIPIVVTPHVTLAEVTPPQITPTQIQSSTETPEILPTPTVEATQNQSGLPISGSNSGPMSKVAVSEAISRNAICNDGTDAVYYIRPGIGEGKARWIIHLQGGGFCYSPESCKARTGEEPGLMTSRQTPDTRPGSGILSPAESDNKFFATYNEVYVAYCSSDFWSGNRAASPETDGLHFRGASIFQAVIEDLSNPSITSGSNLSGATDILLSGSSAGGAGVLVHLDWLAAKFPNANVHGIDDAGWFIDIAPYQSTLPTVDEEVQLAYSYWNGTVDESCGASNSGAEGLCYIGEHVYPFLSTALFVQIAQNDGPQLLNLGITLPLDNAEKTFVDQFAIAVRSSLEPVAAAFSPGNRSHGLLASDEFTSVRINKLSLQDVLGNWLFNLGGPGKVIAQP